MRKTTTTLGAAFLTIALLTSGCGGDDGGDDQSSSDDTSETSETSEPTTDAPDEETDAPTTGISKADFITQADAICQAGNEALNTAFQAVPVMDGKTMRALVSNTVVPNINGQADGIEALGAPGGDEDEVAAIVEAVRAVTAELAADPSLFVDPQSTLFDEADRLATDYGLVVCGSGG